MGEVFISYAWGGESEAIADSLEPAFQEKGIRLVRDKTDLGYKGLIRQFMQQIGQGNCVVAIVSDKYLKSKNCMYELLEISRNGDFYDRIFPIILSDAKIYNPIERLNYIKYWEGKIGQLNEAMREVNLANLQGIREEIDLYTEIRNRIAGLVDILQNMNTLTAEMHRGANFKELVESIAKRLNEEADDTIIPQPSSASPRSWGEKLGRYPLLVRLSFLFMTILFLFYFSRPQIAKIYTQCGVDTLIVEPSKWLLFCNFMSPLSDKNPNGFSEEKLRLESAKNNFDSAIKLDPNNMEAHFYLGYVYEKMGNLEKAKSEYQIAAQSGFIMAINNLGRLLMLEQNHKKAIELMENTVTSKIRNTIDEYYLKKNLAWAYLESGDLNKAQVNLERAFALSQGSLKDRLANDSSPYCLQAILLDKRKEELSKQLGYWRNCMNLNTKETPEQKQWFDMADTKLKQAKKQGLIK